MKSSQQDGQAVEGSGAPAAAAAPAAPAAACWWPCAAGQAMPLDSEGKAQQLRLLRPCAAPHMRSFYLATLSHFVAVFGEGASLPRPPLPRCGNAPGPQLPRLMAPRLPPAATFAAPPLLPVIRDNLDLDKSQIATAGIAAVAGTIRECCRCRCVPALAGCAGAAGACASEQRWLPRVKRTLVRC